MVFESGSEKFSGQATGVAISRDKLLDPYMSAKDQAASRRREEILRQQANARLQAMSIEEQRRFWLNANKGKEHDLPSYLQTSSQTGLSLLPEMDSGQAANSPESFVVAQPGGATGGAEGNYPAIQGLTAHTDSSGHTTYNYHEPSGGVAFNPLDPKDVSSHAWQGVKNTDGSIAINFNGCNVDCDGAGLGRHHEDRTGQSRTALRLSNGQSLDTDKDNFFVLPPEVAHAYGIKLGDLGWLTRKDTGAAVPVIFGDGGPRGKMGEASVKALKDLGFTNANGANGVGKDKAFSVMFVPHSGTGTGDIARDPVAMKQRLDATGKVAAGNEISKNA